MKFKNSHEVNLILIIGTNPLPNYVVLKYFLDTKKINKVYLIHSEHNNHQIGTTNYAESIKKIIKRDYSIPIYLISLSNISSVDQIKRDLEAKLKNFLVENYESSKIILHLNYTGGTKLMAVHIYNYIGQICSEKKYNVKYSYLDARYFRIFYDNGIYEPNGKEDLRKIIKIDISTMLELHLFNKYNEEEFNQNNFVLEKIQDLIQNDNIKIFLKWMDNIRILYDDKFKVNKFKEKINNQCYKKAIEVFKIMPDDILEILNAFPSDKKLNKNNLKEVWVPDDNTSNKQFENRIKNTFKYLNGIWLEDFVYNKLQLELKNYNNSYNYIGHSLKARKIGDFDSKNYIYFELDIYLIYGYQLIGISITTENQKGLCKLKGFEVIHRVRQIGGDEGIAVLITALERNKVDDLKYDLFYSTGSPQDRILVYGIDDWKEIGKRIVEDCKIWKK
ncbi:MAG: DUF1887 domain-containing protein [Promethearchaeota archaeon]